MIGRDVDVEAQKLLANLRDEKLPQKLPEANISRFEVSNNMFLVLLYTLKFTLSKCYFKCSLLVICHVVMYA